MTEKENRRTERIKFLALGSNINQKLREFKEHKDSAKNEHDQKIIAALLYFKQQVTPIIENIKSIQAPSQPAFHTYDRYLTKWSTSSESGAHFAILNTAFNIFNLSEKTIEKVTQHINTEILHAELDKIITDRRKERQNNELTQQPQEMIQQELTQDSANLSSGVNVLTSPQEENQQINYTRLHAELGKIIENRKIAEIPNDMKKIIRERRAFSQNLRNMAASLRNQKGTNPGENTEIEKKAQALENFSVRAEISYYQLPTTILTPAQLLKKWEAIASKTTPLNGGEQQVANDVRILTRFNSAKDNLFTRIFIRPLQNLFATTKSWTLLIKYSKKEATSTSDHPLSTPAKVMQHTANKDRLSPKKASSKKKVLSRSSATRGGAIQFYSPPKQTPTNNQSEQSKPIASIKPK